MSIYSKLSREACEHFIKHKECMPIPTPVVHELNHQQSCYITITQKPGARVRSMYGSALPQTSNLAQEIISNTVTAINANPYSRISRPDLKNLNYHVALLGPLQRISDPEHLDPNIFGLFVKSDNQKSAILLPLREGVQTANDQIGTAMREAGINPNQDMYTMYRFTVTHDDG